MLNKKATADIPREPPPQVPCRTRWTTLRVAPLRCSYPHPLAKLHQKNDMNKKKNMLYNIKWKRKMITKKLKMVAVLTDGDL